MDKQKFDALTRAFATGSSRRTAIKGIFGGAVGVAVATHPPRPRRCAGSGRVCAGNGRRGLSASRRVHHGPPAWTARVLYSGGCEDCDVCDTLSGTCINQCGACEDCAGGQCYSTCSGCESCVGGQCVSYCTDCQKCQGQGVCVDLSDGVCCGGTWIGGGQCCSTGDCIAPDATFCSSVICDNYICTNVPECPDDQQCCGLGSEGAYCADCCDTRRLLHRRTVLRLRAGLLHHADMLLRHRLPGLPGLRRERRVRLSDLRARATPAAVVMTVSPKTNAAGPGRFLRPARSHRSGREVRRTTAATATSVAITGATWARSAPSAVTTGTAARTAGVTGAGVSTPPTATTTRTARRAPAAARTAPAPANAATSRIRPSHRSHPSRISRTPLPHPHLAAR